MRKNFLKFKKDNRTKDEFERIVYEERRSVAEEIACARADMNKRINFNENLYISHILFFFLVSFISKLVTTEIIETKKNYPPTI